MSKPVICIGAAHIDELFHASRKVLLATTSDATITKTAGGVSRNIAHQLAILDVPVHLISVFGDDSDGHWIKRNLYCYLLCPYKNDSSNYFRLDSIMDFKLHKVVFLGPYLSSAENIIIAILI
ncbi:MAG: hypothetical protein H0V91_01740 [Flavisolibacter sp.]|nr:hypothetical protein [Flavisolibacter sp.]